MVHETFLLVFAVAFMGCVLSTPLVTRIAAWAGAIDRPDQFRRVHKGATPRMGGLGLAIGLAVGIFPVAFGGYLQNWDGVARWWSHQWAVVAASIIILGVGLVDDARGMRPRIKLLGQSAAVLVLYLGHIRIDTLALMGFKLNFSYPMFVPLWGGRGVPVDLPSLLVTLIWFLGCMNIWNLIDGMDGLASGVGLLVSGTLMLVAIEQNNLGSAMMAAALAGSLAGFLLYNWHPAVIFLGDSGSLLIGLLIGVIGVQDSLKSSATVSILFPILAMGLPISDTAMAIFRRWVRNLPLSSADRRHIHHLLLALGLNPKQAAFFLYIFTSFLCGVVLIGVFWHNEFLALVMALSGCLAFLLILMSRRDELSNLRQDLRARFERKKQEKYASKTAWEAIQRIELCDTPDKIWLIVGETSRTLGCDALKMSCSRQGRTVLQMATAPLEVAETWETLSGPSATFRLSSGRDLILAVSLHQSAEAELAPDIAFRFLQRLMLATAERLERLLADDDPSSSDEFPGDPSGKQPSSALADSDLGSNGPQPLSSVLTLSRSAEFRHPMDWLRWALGWGPG